MLHSCVPERNHHGQTEDEVDRETPSHLSVGLLLPFLVFPDDEPPHVPVFKWRGHIETENKMEKLVQEVFSSAEFSGGVDLDNERGDKLYGCYQEKQAKGPLKS